MAERDPVKVMVVGSSPTSGANLYGVFYPLTQKGIFLCPKSLS